GNRRNRLASFAGDRVQSVDDVVEELFGDLGSGVGGLVETAGFGERLAAPELAGEASPTERAPDQGADFLVKAEGHQFPLIIAADEGVVDLMGGVAGPSIAVRYAEGLHQMPAGKVGAGDVADFALVHKAVQSIESFFDRRQGVEAVEVVNVHIIGVEAAQ